MMDFEGIEKVRQRVSENGTLYQQLQQMAQQMQKMAAIIDQQNGTNVSEAAGAAAQAAGSTGGGSGSSNVTRSTTQQPGRCGGRREQQSLDTGGQAGHGCEQPEQRMTGSSLRKKRTRKRAISTVTHERQLLSDKERTGKLAARLLFPASDWNRNDRRKTA